MSVIEVTDFLRKNAEDTFGIKKIVAKYMDAIEEIVNIPRLVELVDESLQNGTIPSLIDELVLQSQVEFNLSDDEEEMIKTIVTPDSVQKALDI